MSIDVMRYFLTALAHRVNIRIDQFAHVINLRNEKEEQGEAHYPDLKYILMAAEKIGIRVEYLGDGAYELFYKDIKFRVTGYLISSLDNAFTYWACGNKNITFQLLKKYGFMDIPDYNVFTLRTIDKARNYFSQIGKKVVVKPCAGTYGGQGVTVGIDNIKDLNKAIYNALVYDKRYIIEEYIEGMDYRLLFFRDKLLGAVYRIPARVIGNGSETISGLIKIENEKRKVKNNGLKQIVIDNDLRQCLKNKNMTLDYIPERGEEVYVHSVANACAGGEAIEVSHLVNSDTVKKCSRIIDILQASIVGIDIICKDISQSLGPSNGKINEVNTTPGITIHYNVENKDMGKDVAYEMMKLIFGVQ